MNDLSDLDMRTAVGDLLNLAPKVTDEVPPLYTTTLRSVEMPDRRPVLVAAAVLVAVGAVGLVIVTTGVRSGDDGPVGQTSGDVSEPLAPSDDLPLLVPATPAAFELTQYSKEPANTVGGNNQLMIVGKLASDGSTSQLIGISVGAARNLIGDGGELAFRRDTITLSSGPAELMWLTDNNQVVLQHLSADRAVLITKQTAADGTAPTTDLVAIAESLVVTSTGATLTGVLPDGLQLLASGEQLLYTGPTHILYYAAIDRLGRSFQISVEGQPPVGYQYRLTLDALTPTEVHGKPGFSTTPSFPELYQGASLTWLERPDILVRITGFDMTVDDLRTIASTLRSTTPQQFADFVATANDEGYQFETTTP